MSAKAKRLFEPSDLIMLGVVLMVGGFLIDFGVTGHIGGLGSWLLVGIPLVLGGVLIIVGFLAKDPALDADESH